MAAQDQNDFHTRLQRVTEARATIPVRTPPSRSTEIAGNAMYPMSLAGAFLLGALAVLVGRYIRFQLKAGAEVMATTDTDLIITAAIGAGVSFVLGQMFRLSAPEHISLQGAGVFAMVCIMHNLFHWMPGPMAAAFSPDYVAMVQATTPANSLIVFGNTFTIDMAADEPAPAPREFGPSAQSQDGPRRIILDSDR